MNYDWSKRRALHLGLILATVLVLIVLIWRSLAQLNLARLESVLSGVGVSALFILLPISCATLADTCGWLLCFPGRRRSIRLMDLFRIRMGTDVLSNVIPAGVLVAEPLRPALLCKRSDVSWSEAVASAAIAKVNIALAQGVFILCGLVLLGPLTSLSSNNAVITQQAMYAVFGMISLLIPLALLFYKGRVLGTIGGVMEKFPFGDSVHEKVVPFIKEVEGIIGSYARQMVWRMLASLFVFYLGWLCLAGESFLILLLLGVDVSFAHAILLESTASIVRLLFFFVPATLGTQEAGFVLFFTSLGYNDPLTTSAAFIILKRTKDICWSLMGLYTLSFLGVSHVWKSPVLEGRQGTSL